MNGIGLLRLLIDATGLPPASVELEMNKLIKKAGLNPDSLTLDQVRDLLAEYLKDALIEAKAESSL